MLRMYFCCCCSSQQIHDDDKSFLRQDKDMVTFHMRFKCKSEDCICGREYHPIMNPMIKDKNEDWVPEWNSVRARTRDNLEVIPMIPWL